MEHHANMPRSRKSLRTNDHRALDLVRIADLQNTNGFIGVPMVDIPSTPLLAAWNSKVISRTGEEFINALIRDPGGSHTSPLSRSPEFVENQRFWVFSCLD